MADRWRKPCHHPIHNWRRSRDCVLRANEPERCDLLLEAGTLVTLDRSRPVIEGGSVAIEGESIVAVGPKDAVVHVPR